MPAPRYMTGGPILAKQTGRRQHVLAMEGRAHVRSKSALCQKRGFVRYFTNSTPLGRPPLWEKGSSGLCRRRGRDQPFCGIVWIQLPRLTPSGCRGPKYTVVEPSASASAAGDG